MVVEVLEPLALPCTPTLVPGMVALTLMLPPTVLVTVLEVGTRPLLEFLEPHLASGDDAEKESMFLVGFKLMVSAAMCDYSI